MMFSDPYSSFPFPWDNGAGTGNWNTTDTNWTGSAWTNGPGNTAGFTAVGGPINLSDIVASNVVFGAAWANIPDGSFNGGSLQASRLTVQGMYNNTDGPNPTLILKVPRVSVTGDIAVGRANLRIESGEVIVNRLVTNAESPDYGTLALAGGTLRLNNGIDSSTNGPVPFGMNLSGGALYTPSIRVGDWEQPNFGINVWSVLDGTTIHPTANSSNFITFYGTGQNIFLGNHTSAASFSTDGFDITVGANLLASGTGGLSKQGAGTLTLSGRNTYSGTTAVQGGVLALANQAALGEGPLNISSGAKVALNFTGQSYVTQLTLDGAVQAAGSYGSSSSPATNKNDTWFSGTGVINVSARHRPCRHGNGQSDGGGSGVGGRQLGGSAQLVVERLQRPETEGAVAEHRAFALRAEFSGGRRLYGGQRRVRGDRRDDGLSAAPQTGRRRVQNRVRPLGAGIAGA